MLKALNKVRNVTNNLGFLLSKFIFILGVYLRIELS